MLLRQARLWHSHEPGLRAAAGSAAGVLAEQRCQAPWQLLFDESCGAHIDPGLQHALP